MTEPVAEPMTPPKRFGLSPVMERTIRFLFGMGGLAVTYWQSPSDPPWEWLIVWMTLAGSSLASVADDLRRITKPASGKDADQ